MMNRNDVATEAPRPSPRVRRLLIVQGALLLAGWLALLACQAAQDLPVSSTSTAAAEMRSASGTPRNASPWAFLEGVGVVAAVVAFAWAGRLRAEINRTLPTSAPSTALKPHAIEAA